MSNDILALLGKAHIFCELAPEDREAVATEVRPVSFTANQTIFSRGDPGRDLFIVRSGRVRLSVLTSDGRELSFSQAGPGSVFGEIAMLDGKLRTADATAVTNVEALSLGQGAMAKLIRERSGLADVIIRFLCQRLRETDLQLEGVALHRIEVRLARFLVGLAMQAGTNEADGELQLELGMSQGELALLLGASRPKVNGALTLLEEQGVIRRSGGSISCDLDELRVVAEMD